MKVVKKGRGTKGWAKEYECTGKGNGEGGCGALLMVEQDDVFVTSTNTRDETTTHYTFRCCECGVWTDIPPVPFKARKINPKCDGEQSGARLPLEGDP